MANTTENAINTGDLESCVQQLVKIHSNFINLQHVTPEQIKAYENYVRNDLKDYEPSLRAQRIYKQITSLPLPE
jgi:hypothetical protein